VLVHDAGDQPAHTLRPLARALARHGIAVLTYDKRGVGDSTGDWRAGTFETLADDALAAIRVLRARRDVNPSRVGLLGIGEGGWVAPIAAARSPEVAFLITIAAPAMNPVVQERYRRAYALRCAGHGPWAMTVSATLWLLACAIWRRLPERSDAPPTLRRYFARVCAHDPLPVWTQVRQPVLALWGGRDERVPPRGSAWLLRRALRASGHMASTTTIVPGGGHLLQVSGQQAGAAMMDTALLVARWIQAQSMV
jgi:pimeloyl-ACP methyl ester carboxylesterase